MTEKIYIAVTEETTDYIEQWMDDRNTFTGAFQDSGMNVQKGGLDLDVFVIDQNASNYASFKSLFLKKYTPHRRQFANRPDYTPLLNLLDQFKDSSFVTVTLPSGSNETQRLENIFSSDVLVNLGPYQNNPSLNKVQLIFNRENLTLSQKKGLELFYDHLYLSTDSEKEIVSRYGTDYLNLFLFAESQYSMPLKSPKAVDSEIKKVPEPKGPDLEIKKEPEPVVTSEKEKEKGQFWQDLKEDAGIFWKAFKEHYSLLPGEAGMGIDHLTQLFSKEKSSYRNLDWNSEERIYAVNKLNDEIEGNPYTSLGSLTGFLLQGPKEGLREVIRNHPDNDLTGRMVIGADAVYSTGAALGTGMASLAGAALELGPFLLTNIIDYSDSNLNLNISFGNNYTDLRGLVHFGEALFWNPIVGHDPLVEEGYIPEEEKRNRWQLLTQDGFGYDPNADVPEANLAETLGNIAALGLVARGMYRGGKGRFVRWREGRKAEVSKAETAPQEAPAPEAEPLPEKTAEAPQEGAADSAAPEKTSESAPPEQPAKPETAKTAPESQTAPAKSEIGPDDVTPVDPPPETTVAKTEGPVKLSPDPTEGPTEISPSRIPPDSETAPPEAKAQTVEKVQRLGPETEGAKSAERIPLKKLQKRFFEDGEDLPYDELVRLRDEIEGAVKAYENMSPGKLPPDILIDRLALIRGAMVVFKDKIKPAGNGTSVPQGIIVGEPRVDRIDLVPQRPSTEIPHEGPIAVGGKTAPKLPPFIEPAAADSLGIKRSLRVKPTRIFEPVKTEQGYRISWELILSKGKKVQIFADIVRGGREVKVTEVNLGWLKKYKIEFQGGKTIKVSRITRKGSRPVKPSKVRGNKKLMETISTLMSDPFLERISLHMEGYPEIVYQRSPKMPPQTPEVLHPPKSLSWYFDGNLVVRYPAEKTEIPVKSAE